MIMIRGTGLVEGAGLGCLGVNAIPRGRPGSALETRGVTSPVASAANSIKSALFVLGL
jgi:hypothetical protein